MSSSTTESDSEIAARADIEKIFRAAIDAVDPARLVGRAMDGESAGAEQVPDLIVNAPRVFLLAVGKAAAAMAAEIERRVGAKIVDAIAVVPKSAAATTTPASKVRVLPSAHPIPDESSEAAAHTACKMLRALAPDDLLIVALSGGASAMFTMPADSIPLA